MTFSSIPIVLANFNKFKLFLEDLLPKVNDEKNKNKLM